MNINEAIAAHVEWKAKLSSYLSRPDESLNYFDILANDRCQLGLWLYGKGRSLARYKEYENAVQLHTRFHRAAAEVVRRANAQESVDEDVVLGSRSDFAMRSVDLVNALLALKKFLS